MKSMVGVIPEGDSSDGCRIKYVTVDQAAAMRTLFRAHVHDDYVPPGTYVQLYVQGQLTMSDTRMERRSNLEVVRRAHGHVLVAGLGIGFILGDILAKPEVLSLTVVEKYQGVIDLVAPHVSHPKLMIVKADIFDWTPPKEARFSTIYFDIWPQRCLDNLEQMNRLHRKFRRYLDKADCPWMESWYRDELRQMRAAEAKRRRDLEKVARWRFGT